VFVYYGVAKEVNVTEPAASWYRGNIIDSYVETARGLGNGSSIGCQLLSVFQHLPSSTTVRQATALVWY
jgi:hypothetical protein